MSRHFCRMLPGGEAEGHAESNRPYRVTTAMLPPSPNRGAGGGVRDQPFGSPEQGLARLPLTCGILVWVRTVRPDASAASALSIARVNGGRLGLARPGASELKGQDAEKGREPGRICGSCASEQPASCRLPTHGIVVSTAPAGGCGLFAARPVRTQEQRIGRLCRHPDRASARPSAALRAKRVERRLGIRASARREPARTRGYSILWRCSFQSCC